MHSPSQPAVLERAGLKNIAVRNSVATCSQAQGKDGGRVGRGRSRARGQRGAPAMDPVLGSIPVTSWKARGIPHMGLQGLEQGFACCTRPLPAQHSKKHTTTTKKKSSRHNKKTSCYLQAISVTRKLAYVSINSSNRLSRRNERKPTRNYVHGLVCRQNMLPTLL